MTNLQVASTEAGAQRLSGGADNHWGRTVWPEGREPRRDEDSDCLRSENRRRSWSGAFSGCAAEGQQRGQSPERSVSAVHCVFLILSPPL